MAAVQQQSASSQLCHPASSHQPATSSRCEKFESRSGVVFAELPKLSFYYFYSTSTGIVVL
jgi:hypothetical protein